MVAVCWRDGMGVEGEDFARIAVFGEGEGFGLFVAVGGDEAALGGGEGVRLALAQGRGRYWASRQKRGRDWRSGEDFGGHCRRYGWGGRQVGVVLRFGELFAIIEVGRSYDVG